ncbi:hypothetical protein BUALT_Bualt11G0046000 [Buddleja alternifolia]|uniref:Uncharacterized protein n=1 Tax=Buddleja alternifolia TaxID=168488 RepID=A0AAV6WYV4_9LAMI|nr:hypothetical protein BUALT_Bualt11G0046000 [Buddleja alternifolia]
MVDSRADSGANSKKRRACNWYWSRKEDELLIELIKKHGTGNWRSIASHLSGRTAMSCRLRWVNHLNPEVDKTPLSEEEQEKLLELHKEYGNKWSTIVGFFPHRTDNQIKNQYHAMMGKMKILSYGNTVISDAATSQVYQVGQPQEGVLKDYQFIDFMGVGNPDVLEISIAVLSARILTPDFVHTGISEVLVSRQCSAAAAVSELLLVFSLNASILLNLLI